MNKVGLMFLMIVVLGIGLYLFNSGVIGKGVNSLISSAPNSSSSFFFGFKPQPQSSTRPVTGPVASSSSGGTTTKPPTKPATTTPAISPYDIPPGYTAAQLSPYFHQVRFAGVSAGTAYSYGQIGLSASMLRDARPIDITGWHIKTVRGGLYIPQAVNVYDPTGLAAASDIYMKSGDRVYLYSSSAPVNLRLNKCMGLLPAASRKQFNPQLPANCPAVDRSEIQTFTGACQNYILSLGCRQPDLSSPYVPRNDYACQEYLSTHFSYRSCFDDHQTDSDFLSSEVRVWTGSSPVDRYHDKVFLFDINGLVVDYYSY